MERGRPFEGRLTNNIIEFTQMGPEAGVSMFVLKGSMDGSPATFSSFASLGLDIKSKQTYFVVSIDPEVPSHFEMYNKILDLELPERVADLNVLDIETLADNFRKRFGAKKMPFIVLSFGKNDKNGDESVVLSVIAGISPKAALSAIKESVRMRKSTFN